MNTQTELYLSTNGWVSEPSEAINFPSRGAAEQYAIDNEIEYEFISKINSNGEGFYCIQNN